MSETPSLPQPTKPELAILKLLWESDALSARAVDTQISPIFEWSFSTLRTVLERMVDKGLLSKQQEGGVNVYTAAVGKVSFLGRMIEDMTSRVMEFDATPAAVMFANSKLLSEDELEELEAMLKRGDDA